MTGENKAPFEIMPIPGKVHDASASLVDGKFVCNICNNKFSEEQQFTLHKNIHYFERPFRCEGMCWKIKHYEDTAQGMR